jgi:hypothetical protein
VICLVRRACAGWWRIYPCTVEYLDIYMGPLDIFRIWKAMQTNQLRLLFLTPATAAPGIDSPSRSPMPVRSLLRAGAVWAIRRSSSCEDLRYGRNRWLVNRVLNPASHSRITTTLTSTFLLQQPVPSITEVLAAAAASDCLGSTCSQQLLCEEVAS